MNNYLVLNGPGLRDIQGLETGLLKNKIEYHVINGICVRLENGLLKSRLINILLLMDLVRTRK